MKKYLYISGKNKSEKIEDDRIRFAEFNGVNESAWGSGDNNQISALSDKL
jgi:hypothetical protein